VIDRFDKNRKCYSYYFCSVKLETLECLKILERALHHKSSINPVRYSNWSILELWTFYIDHKIAMIAPFGWRNFGDEILVTKCPYWLISDFISKKYEKSKFTTQSGRSTRDHISESGRSKMTYFHKFKFDHFIKVGWVWVDLGVVNFGNRIGNELQN